MTKIISFKKKEKELNFKVFARHVGEGRTDEATRVLRDLLNCDFEEAQRVTHHFKKKYDESPDVIMRLMLIKAQLEQGKQNDALVTIQDILGLTGPLSVQVLQLMKEMVN